MTIGLLILSVILSLFANMVLGYISIATMVGPWIAPTIVLVSALVWKLFGPQKEEKERNQILVLIQTVGSVGGIVATAVGFTLPTLYFLDPIQFNNLMKHPFQFISLVGAFCIISGAVGIWLARSFAHKFICKDELQFPVSSLIKETIMASSDGKKITQLVSGFFSTAFICFLRDGIQFGRFFSIKNLLPTKGFLILERYIGSAFPVSISPMFWAIGYITGPAVVMPLLVGMLSKYAVVAPIVNHSQWLPWQLFNPIDEGQFTMALSAGLAVSELLFGVLRYPEMIWNGIKYYSGYKVSSHIDAIKNFVKSKLSREKDCDLNETYGLTASQARIKKIEAILIFGAAFALLSVFKFPLLAQLLIIGLTTITTYQICYLGAKIGFVQFGRFATYVMIPTLLVVHLTALQITLLCLFVVISAATASDLLFNYKIGEYFDVSFKRIQRYQTFGLLISAISIGFFLWLLFTHLQLGSADLFAQRGRSRALLIQSLHFDWSVVGLGALYGLLLKKLKVNPTMVFGGLLMPNNLTLGLVIGALGSLLSKNRREQYAFFSGVFSGESVWLIVSILATMLLK